jgi:hypothetical protein
MRVNRELRETYKPPDPVADVKRRRLGSEYIIFIIIIYYTANGFLPGGSSTTIGQHTNNTHHTK